MDLNNATIILIGILTVIAGMGFGRFVVAHMRLKNEVKLKR